MWCIYFFILIIYCIAVTVAYGIRIQLRADYDNLSVCTRVYIFEWIEIFSVNLFINDNKFYYSVNRGDIKALKARNKQNKGKITDERKKIKHVDYYGLISRILNDMPSFEFNELKLSYSIDFNDEMQKALFGSAAGIIMSVIKAIFYDKIKVKNLLVEDIRQVTEMRGVIIDCVFDFVIFKILLYILHILALKNKYTSKSYA